MPKMKSIILLASQIIFALSFYGCKGDSESKSVDDIKYNKVKIVYTKGSIPWGIMECWKIGPFSPMEFTKPRPVGYGGFLKCMEIRDTSFINMLSEMIRNRPEVTTESYKGDFSPYFLVLLDNNKEHSVDTLAVEPPYLWFNGEVYIDSCTVKLITDKLIKQDKEFAESAEPYYEDGKWYPYVGKDMNILK